MSKPHFILFNVTNELVEDAYTILGIASKTGRIIKGASKSLDAVGKRKVKLVVIAEDARTSEAISHLPYLCADTKTPVTYVPSKKTLGKKYGDGCNITAVCITDLGEASDLYNFLFLPKLEKIKEERSIKY